VTFRSQADHLVAESREEAWLRRVTAEWDGTTLYCHCCGAVMQREVSPPPRIEGPRRGHPFDGPRYWCDKGDAFEIFMSEGKVTTFVVPRLYPQMVRKMPGMYDEWVRWKCLEYVMFLNFRLVVGRMDRVTHQACVEAAQSRLHERLRLAYAEQKRTDDDTHGGS
jgi:hypothetical protein